MNDMSLAPHTRRIPKMQDIPRGRYLDESLYRAEMDHVFRKTWHLVGHVSEFTGEGSYRLLDLPFAPVFVVRGKDGRLRAFLNACAHRGATVLKDEEGIARSLTCQFHGWTYDLTGKLLNVPDAESFQELETDARALTPVRLELWGGMVFINLDQGAKPLLEAIAPIARRYSEIANANLRVVSRRSFEADCNWKVMEDAFRESYHIPVTHRQTAAAMLDAPKTEYIVYEQGHWTMRIPYPQGAAWTLEMFRSLPVIPGTDSEEFQTHAMVVGLFPNMRFTFQNGGFSLMRIWPLGKDRCRPELIWFGMDWGDAPRPEAWDMIIGGFDALVAEDVGNTAAVQRAALAEPHRGMPLSDQEVLMYQFHAELDRLIGAEHVPPGLHIPDILGDVAIP